MSGAMKYRKGRDSNGDKSQNGVGDVSVSPSIKLDITVHPSSGVSVPFSELWTPTPGSGGSVRGGNSPGYGRSDPPEKQLTLLALRVAILEKVASGIGKLDFVWATVVLLGGFVGSLHITDFWCITVILVGEGARVFSRGHEAEWQHHATETSTAGGAIRSSTRLFRRILHAVVDHTGGGGREELEPHQHDTQTTDAHAGGALRSSSRFFRRVVHALAHRAADGADVSGDASTTPARFQNQIAAVMKKRTGHAPNVVSLLPGTGQVFTSRNIGRLLNWLQVLSALACVALSLMRLGKHGDFGGSGNMRPALLIFYTLAMLEALLFLLEKAYWARNFSCAMLRQVSKDCQLGEYGQVSLTRFFYDAYSRCVTGSIFDGIKMDLVTFAEELILSDFLDEQLIGVRILQQFAEKVDSAGDTLRQVGTSPRSIERLVEMLNWKRPDEVEVRQSAAGVVCRLAGKRQNALRLSAIPGAIESVTCLLYKGRSAAVSGMHPQPNVAAGEGGPLPGLRDYDYLPFNLLGLRILKKLARDQDSCGKISNARGLLAKIIDFTTESKDLLRNQHVSDSQLRAVKRALQVVKMLVNTTGNTGKAVRQGVAEYVFAVSNLREILRNGQLHKELQKLAIDILTGLAMDDSGKEAIMGTGGLVKLLLSIFVCAEERELGHGAGKALAMLALQSETGCAAILKRADVLDLVSALQDGDDARRLNAARVLRSLCAYSGPEYRVRLRVVTKALPVVLGVTMTKSDLVLEVCVGLTTQICRFIDGERFAAELHVAGVEERAYVQRLATILGKNEHPKVKIPRMRRFVVQQVIWLMTCSGGVRYMELLRGVGMEGLLETIADTTSELENYHVFSGSVGIGKHRVSFPSIVDSALELIKGGGGGASSSVT